MLNLCELTDQRPGDDLAEIMLAFTVADELEQDAHEQMGQLIQSADWLNLLEQLRDCHQLRHSYLERFRAMVQPAGVVGTA